MKCTRYEIKLHYERKIITTCVVNILSGVNIQFTKAVLIRRMRNCQFVNAANNDLG